MGRPRHATSRLRLHHVPAHGDERRPADPRVQRGRRAEDAAAELITRAGIEILARNVRAARYEIDLLGREGDTIVIVEVRSRSTARFGSPVETVGYEKQRRIVRAAWAILARAGWSDRPVRFDVVGVRWEGEVCLCSHVRAAFEARV